MGDFPPELTAWVEVLAKQFDGEHPPLDAGALDTVLGLAGVVAHQIVRPGAPVTTYVLGYLAAQSAQKNGGVLDDATLSELSATITALVKEHRSQGQSE